jgi:hypothetical protein
MTEKSISERLDEYRASAQFKEDFAVYSDFARSVGSSESREQIITELMRAKAEQLEASDVCEREGHKWIETAYLEDSASGLDCERCGEHQQVIFY